MSLFGGNTASESERGSRKSESRPRAPAQVHDGSATLAVQRIYGSPCGFRPTTCGQTASQSWVLIIGCVLPWRQRYTVHFDDDAGFPVGVSEAGAPLQDAAFKLAHLFDGLAVLLGVLAHRTQPVALLDAVVVACTQQPRASASRPAAGYGSGGGGGSACTQAAAAARAVAASTDCSLSGRCG